MSTAKRFRLTLLSLLIFTSSAFIHYAVVLAKPVATTRSGLAVGQPFESTRSLPQKVTTRGTGTTRQRALRDGGNDDSLIYKSYRNPLTLAALALAAFLYWYWLVLGAAVQANGLPGIPDFLPMVPGWPPSEQDLQGPLEDVPHFFYLSELLGNKDAPLAPPTRLAVYNLVEAWIFSFLPALWNDPLRLPRPLLLSLWAVLGIGLTNAFLAPYLFLTAAFGSPSATESREKNLAVSYVMGGIATGVSSFALFQTATLTTPQDWADFFQVCRDDRTYLAFVVDIFLFSLFQPYILMRADGAQENRPIDFVPFVGTMAWLFRRSGN